MLGLLIHFAPGCGGEDVAQQQGSQGEDAVFSSPLQRALRRGLAPGGDLADELQSLSDYKISSKKDAKAIVEALSRLPSTDIQSSGYSSPLYTLVGLFQDLDGRDAPAFEILRDAGTHELLRIFDELKGSFDDAVHDDLLFLLKILAMYGTHDGAERIVEAARIPIKPDGYMWSVILSGFKDGHPERDFVYRSLSNPVPPGFIAVGLLDAANSEAIEGQLDDHPFDNDHGYAQLRAWLTSRNPNEFSYAHSATATLPFLDQSERNWLLGLAREHTDTGVRMEAAWASAKLGQEIGFQMLRDYCLDINYSSTAIQYLTELEREDIVPQEASEPEFQAKAEFANWLAHPNELGRPPDKLEVLDHRTIYWPPGGEDASLWLIKYRLADLWGLEADDVDCGLVGSTTWCIFSYKMHQRPPEDCYAIHCCWELELEDSEVDDPAEYEAMLKQWPHGPLTNVEVSRVVELPPELKYGRRLVAIASAKMNNVEGWAVLDGDDSLWYPASVMPEGEYVGAVLKVHVGRKLLGFPPAKDRRRVLDHIPEPLLPENVVAAYDKLLKQCQEGTVDQKVSLLEDWRSPMITNSVWYAEACESIGRETKSAALVRVFMTMLGAIETMPDEIKGEAYGRFGLPVQFEAFLDSLVEVGQAEKLPQLVALLEPYLDHNRGYGLLGSMAYRGEDYATAERLIVKLQKSLADWHRAEEMILLARVWHQQGKSQEARQVLVSCLQGLVKEIKEAKYSSDRKMFEKKYQDFLRAFLKLFPDDVEKLEQLGLPKSTLN
jgi:hypothetical protein